MADSPFFKAPHQRYPDLPQQGGLYLARNFDEVQRFISGPKGMTTLRVTSTTRPSTPYSGQQIYETDTGLIQGLERVDLDGDESRRGLDELLPVDLEHHARQRHADRVVREGSGRARIHDLGPQLVHVEYHHQVRVSWDESGRPALLDQLARPSKVTPFRNSAPIGMGYGFNAGRPTWSTRSAAARASDLRPLSSCSTGTAPHVAPRCCQRPRSRSSWGTSDGDQRLHAHVSKPSVTATT
jgi:hypothetical protein